MHKKYRDIHAFLEAEDYQNAYKEIMQINVSSEKDLDFYVLRGYCELKVKKYEESKISFEKSLEIKPNIVAWEFLSEIYTIEKKLNKAFSALFMPMNLPRNEKLYRKILGHCLVLGKFENLVSISKFPQLKEIGLKLIHDRKDFQQKIKSEEAKDLCFIADSSNNESNNEEINENNFDSSNRSQLMKEVFILIKNHKFIEALNLIQIGFFANNIEETVDKIIENEWIDFLYQILLEFLSLRYCMLSLKIINELRSIFLTYKSNFIDCVNYLLEQKQYDKIYEVGILCIEMNPIYFKIERIIQEITTRHPDYSLYENDCSCNKLEDKLQIFNKLFRGVNYLTE